MFCRVSDTTAVYAIAFRVGQQLQHALSGTSDQIAPLRVHSPQQEGLVASYPHNDLWLCVLSQGCRQQACLARTYARQALQIVGAQEGQATGEWRTLR